MFSGHNIFGEDIVKTLEGTADIKERSKFILMDKIQPPVSKNYIVRAELPQPVLADVISELGFYGILIRLVKQLCSFSYRKGPYPTRSLHFSEMFSSCVDLWLSTSFMLLSSYW